MGYQYIFRFYIATDITSYEKLIADLRTLLNDRLNGDYSLEVVNILENPELAERDNIVATPTLVRISPPPVCKVVGDFSDTGQVLAALGIG